MRVVVYGEGGYDAAVPGSNVVAEYEVPDEVAPAGPDLAALATALAEAPELSETTRMKLIAALQGKP